MAGADRRRVPRRHVLLLHRLAHPHHVANTFVLMSVSPFLAALERPLGAARAVPLRTWLAMAVAFAASS
jgi:hypothetical protein